MLGNCGIENVVLEYIKLICVDDNVSVRFWSELKLHGALFTHQAKMLKASVFQHGVSDQNRCIHWRVR